MAYAPTRIEICPRAVRKAIGQPVKYRAWFFASIALLYGVFAALLLAAAWSAKHHVLLYTAIPLWLAMGMAQYVLAQSLHEAWHFHYSGWAGLASRLFISYPLLIPPVSRSVHFEHHKFFGENGQDPDYRIYDAFPRRKKEFLRFLLEGLSGLSAAKRFLQLIGAPQVSQPSGKKSGGAWKEILPLLAVQGIIAVFCTWLYSPMLPIPAWHIALPIPVLYAFFWVFPIVSVVKTVNDLRLIAEHGQPQGGAALRSFLHKGLLSRLIGAYGFSDHAEHHLVPTIHWRDLPRVKQLILTGHTQLRSEETVVIEYTPISYAAYLRYLYSTLT